MKKVRIDTSQKMTADAVRLGQQIPYIHALVELDVTEAKIALRNYRKVHGQKISFSAYVMHCVAQATARHLQLTAVWGSRKKTLYDEVDFFFAYENSSHQLQHQLIRNIQRKSISQLHQILSELVKGKNKPLMGSQKFFLKLPWSLRKLFYKIWFLSATTKKKYFGTVYFSSIINYSADRRTWGIPLPMHSLGIFIGTVSNRLIKNQGEIEERQMLQITVSVDHRISNGGDMARFVHCLKDIIENQKLKIE
ncbi:MAG: 2-oxo acid dehydrogenase subunit E2 [Flavobacteriales bacterium]|nr:2-oxo acid dehydrogenase subunit E2 [Flavobacteriales bacterium]